MACGWALAYHIGFPGSISGGISAFHAWHSDSIQPEWMTSISVPFVWFFGCNLSDGYLLWPWGWNLFQISLLRREDFHSLSNMPRLSSNVLSDGWVEDVYAPTLNTSTYLLAFVVSQYDSLSGLDSKGRNVGRLIFLASRQLPRGGDTPISLGTKISRYRQWMGKYRSDSSILW